MSNNDSNTGNLKKNGFPDLESLPELDNLFDEFDSQNKSTEEDKTSKNFNEDLFEEFQEEDVRNPEPVIQQSASKPIPAMPEEIYFEEENPQVNKQKAEPSFELPKMELPTIDPDFFDDEEEQDDEDDIFVEDEEDFNETDSDLVDEDLEEVDFEFEQFQVVEEEKLDDPNYDLKNDEEILDVEEEDPYGYDLSKEGMGSLLPGMESDEFSHVNQIEEDNEEDNEDNKEDEEIYDEPSSEEKSSKKPGEIDEDKLKEAITGFFGKFKKSGDKDSKAKKPKSERTPKSKPNLKINKKTAIIAGSIIGAIIIIIAFFLFLGKGYAQLGEINSPVKGEDFDISLSEYKITEKGKLSIKFKNNGDISKDISSYVTLKEKSFIPFLGTSIICESDIIAIEPNGATVVEILTCDGELTREIEYKETVEIDEI